MDRRLRPEPPAQRQSARPHAASSVNNNRWDYLNRVIVTAGPVQSRFKPGIAIQIVRECLAALAALHREQIVHGDLKPSNIMIKRTGNAKIVDIGSAVCLDDVPVQRTCTPTYAAPEVLEGGDCTPRADLASLGYVLIEMLAGRSPFAGHDDVSRAVGGEAVFGPTPAADLAARGDLQRAVDGFCAAA